MVINYLFGNGFSIEFDSNYKYSKLLEGFVDEFYDKTKITLNRLIETNPEVYFENLIRKPQIKKFEFKCLILSIQIELKKFLIKKIGGYKNKNVEKLFLDGYSSDSKISTTNYDLNVQNIFNLKNVNHLHGSIDKPETIIFTAASAKGIFAHDIRNYFLDLRGELRIFGLKPNFDKHIWDAIFLNKHLEKIVFTFYEENEEEKLISLNLASLRKNTKTLPSKEFIESFFTKVY